MKTLRRTLGAIALAALIARSLPAQDSPVIAIRGGKIFTLAGPPIESGTVLIQDGRILEVRASTTVPPDAQVIDATGHHVYPGLFDAMMDTVPKMPYSSQFMEVYR